MRPEVRKLLISSAGFQTVPELTQAVCDALATPAAVLVRIWLLADDQSLRLCASAGTPLGGGSYRRLDGEFSVIHHGSGKIGRIATAREPLVARHVRGDEDWLANPAWIARQNVRSFIALPLVAGDRSLGVLALFDRVVLTDAALDELTFIADFVAARIRALQDSRPESPRGAASPVSTLSTVLTRRELRDLEKRSIEAALSRTHGRVFGPGGAAALLDMKPTTLASRIKALRVRPARE